MEFQLPRMREIQRWTQAILRAVEHARGSRGLSTRPQAGTFQANFYRGLKSPPGKPDFRIQSGYEFPLRERQNMRSRQAQEKSRTPCGASAGTSAKLEKCTRPSKERCPERQIEA